MATKKQKDVLVLQAGAARKKTSIKVGDHVFVNRGEHNRVGVAKVVSYSKDEPDNITIAWYYPKDQFNGDDSLHWFGVDELVETDHVVTLQVSRLNGKCEVHSFDAYLKKKYYDNTYEKGKYFFSRAYYHIAGGCTVKDEDVSVYCKCESPWNPDDGAMVEREVCGHWFHQVCVSKDQLNEDHFTCNSCEYLKEN